MISVGLVFKVINFLVLIFVFVYLMKKKIVPFFLEEKKRADDDFKDKKTSRKLLQKQLNQLVEDHAEQKVEGKMLAKKCKLWAEKIYKNREQTQQELEEAKVRMIKRRQAQWLFVQQQRCLQQKLPVIFENVEKHFQELEAKGKISKTYCETLVSFLKEQK